jgi:hypothetical protein
LFEHDLFLLYVRTVVFGGRDFNRKFGFLDSGGFCFSFGGWCWVIFYDVHSLCGRVDQHHTTSFGAHTAKQCDSALDSQGQSIDVWVSPCVDIGLEDN